MNSYFVIAALRQLFARQPGLLSNVRLTQDPATLAEQLAHIAAANGVRTNAAEIRRHVRDLRASGATAVPEIRALAPHGHGKGMDRLARSECAALLKMCELETRVAEPLL